MAKKKATRKKTTKKTTRSAGRKKTTARKTSGRKKAAKKTARKTTARKKTAKKTTKKAARKPARITAASKPRTKSEVYSMLAENAGITKKEVATVFDTLSDILKADLSKRGPGALNLAGLMKITVQRKPATRARKGTNPFTGEPCIFKAKPARNVVKIRPMKAIKDLV